MDYIPDSIQKDSNAMFGSIADPTDQASHSPTVSSIPRISGEQAFNLEALRFSVVHETGILAGGPRRMVFRFAAGLRVLESWGRFQPHC
jgi:hypothetical protein